MPEREKYSYAFQASFVQPGVAQSLIAVYYTSRHEGRRYQVVLSLNFRSVVNASHAYVIPAFLWSEDS